MGLLIFPVVDTYDFPLHFMAKVKAKKEIKVCVKQILHFHFVL